MKKLITNIKKFKLVKFFFLLYRKAIVRNAGFGDGTKVEKKNGIVQIWKFTYFL